MINTMNYINKIIAEAEENLAKNATCKCAVVKLDAPHYVLETIVSALRKRGYGATLNYGSNVTCEDILTFVAWNPMENLEAELVVNH